MDLLLSRRPTPGTNGSVLIGASRTAATKPYVAFAEDASRIRKNPDIAARLRSFAYNTIRASGGDNVQNTRWRAALDLGIILKMTGITEN